jgi:predicted nucleic acid-binding protein
VIRQYVLDSSAIIIYIRNSPDASRVRKVFQEVASGDAMALISAVNWAECRNVLIRRHGAEQAVELLAQLSQGLQIVPADQAHAEAAGDLRCRFNGSLADCFAASLAISRRATLVTADPEFEAIKTELKIIRLETVRR